MVHLEMSYLTHFKFFTTMIPDILPCSVQGLEFSDELYNSNSLPLEIRSN